MEVDFGEGHAFECVAGEGFSVEAGVLLAEAKPGGTRGEVIQVRDVDRNFCFSREVVCQQADVGIIPAKEVGDEHDGCIGGGGSDVGLVTGGGEGDGAAGRGAVPFEAFCAACGGRHGGDVLDME